ncbi:tetratricopeptide repeat-containing sulfotransferase family protein [Pseudodonghicola flavimaris]|uniref:Sulfotransferase n=1 Tax=Pseudodonghicola flavimaris TaxID=3050036 RepID=A0ABT7F4I7_9RHOB|nr:tetratricopeptide repeat-containing sulfotransferase family protein [Pseudodonghicola flavimaris]MDK3019517.1 sulfotransferase [Pseudodonghicola flavimaris]
MTLQTPLARAQSHLMNGQYKQALKSAKAAMARAPKDARLPNLVGVAMCGLGQQREALAMFQKAMKLDPGFPDPHRNLGQTLILLGQADKALTVLERLCATQPGDEGAQYLVAQALANLGRSEAAEAAAGRAIALAPRQARSYNLRGLMRDQMGQSDAALRDFETALDIDPNNIETLINISLPLARQLRQEEALAVVRKAVALAPGHVGAHLRLATALTETGDRQAAAAEYQRVLKLDPRNAQAIEQLSLLQDPAENAALAPVAQAALKRAPARGADKALLNFALARIADQADDIPRAARHWAEANRDMARQRPYDPEADTALNDRLLGYFPLPPAMAEEEIITPIYVLGLPRSGTTLAEAILAAHPQVAGLGEQIAAGRYFYPLVEAQSPIGATELAQFRSFETQQHPPLPAGSRAFVDKMPENYRLLGFLAAAHPRARIVHLTRDPRDIALSMWRSQFQGGALNYTYDLRAMGHRFNLYARMMQRWHALFPDRIFDLSYEAMTADIDAASRQLADHCGLDWQAQMARPHETGAAVLTMSATQLRQPVHRRSVGKWRAYAEILAPFTETLDPALWPGVSDTGQP